VDDFDLDLDPVELDLQHPEFCHSFVVPRLADFPIKLNRRSVIKHVLSNLDRAL
jgi:hypothetical protein